MRLGNAREEEKASNQLARFVRILYSLFYLTRILYYHIKVDTFTTAVCRSSSFEAQERERERERRERLLPALYALLIEEGRQSEKDSGW